MGRFRSARPERPQLQSPYGLLPLRPLRPEGIELVEVSTLNQDLTRKGRGNTLFQARRAAPSKSGVLPPHSKINPFN
jgi:hypothetical protein